MEFATEHNEKSCGEALGTLESHNLPKKRKEVERVFSVMNG